MKKKLALLMAAIMTVAMVPATAFASTKLTAVDEVTTGTDDIFTSRVELKKSNDQVDVTDVYKSDENGKADDDGTYKAFDVILKLTNGTFAKNEDIDDDYNDKYIMDSKNTLLIDTNNDDTGDTPVYETYYDASDDNDRNGILAIEVTSSTSATITLDADKFNEVTTDDICILPIVAKATETGDVTATFTSNVSGFKKASEVIATAVDGDADVAIDGVTTFVEDGDKVKEIKDITINGLSNGAIASKNDITLKLKGNYEFSTKDNDGNDIGQPKVTLLNDTATATATIDSNSKDKVTIKFNGTVSDDMLAKITIENVYLKATKDCDSGDVATITVSSDDFDSVKLEAAKMVEEAVTYSVEDKTLPTIWAGKNYAIDDDSNTLKLSVEENTGDILNTSRKATFTFPEGIEVVGIADDKGFTKTGDKAFKYEIDENVLTIYNYQKGTDESKKTDFSLKFILNAAPTFSGDVTVTLGGQFDDTSFKVATVKAPYTVEAKTSEVLIDYRYVPVNDIVITEAEDGILKEDDKIVLAVEKMNFEDAGDVEVTEGDIDVDVDIDDKGGVYLYDDKTDADYLVVTVKDESTEASTIVISGLELYLDRTLPVGGYALQNVGGTFKSHSGYDYSEDTILADSKTYSEDAINVLWENSMDDKDIYDYTPDEKLESNGIFKYKSVTANDEYVNVITAARDSDDSMTTKKIVITVGATTMTAGTETVTLDAPAYINAENYTMLPLRAITEAFGATVNWDNATRTVTILKGQRIVSMTIGSKTMYVNGTPVAMNTAPEISADRTFVPVRDLANSLGISNVNWTEASGTVTLN